jgi:adhesin/invasin
VNITATVNGSNSLSKPTTFVADSSSAQISDLTVTTGAVANGTATNLATVVVKDGNNNPLANADVTWSQDGTAAFGTSAKTDATGKTTVTITDTKAETVNITATVNGSSLSKPTTFVADSSSAQVSDLTVTTGALANGTATNQATVTVTDGNNNPLANADVTWLQDGTAAFGTSAKTDATGKTTVTITDTKAETVNITATVNGSSLSKPTTFVADSSSAQISDLTVTTGAAANGTATNQATVTVKDGNNNPLTNVDVTWSQDGTAAFGTSAKTDATGKTTVTITDTKAETVNITATVNSSSLSKPTTFVADTDTAAVSELTVTPASSPADGVTVKTGNVIVKDKNDNLVPNATVTFAITKGAAVFVNSSQSITASTDAQGAASTTFTDTTAETVTLSAKAGTSDTGKTQDSSFVNAITVNLTCNGSCRAASNGAGTVTASVAVQNNGKPLPNANVSVSVSGSAQLSSNSVTTDSNGNATFSLTDMSDESVNITVSYQGVTDSLNAVFYVPTLTTITMVADVNGHGMSTTDLNSFHAIAYDQDAVPMAGVDLEMSLGQCAGGNARFATADGTIQPVNSLYQSTTGSDGVTADEGYLYSTTAASCDLSVSQVGGSIRSDHVTITFSR